MVDLVGISWGFERSFLALYEAKGIDLVVVRAGISNQLSSTLDQKLGDRLRAIEGVAEVAPSLMDTVSFEEATSPACWSTAGSPGACSSGARTSSKAATFGPGEDNVAMLGRVLALNLGKKVGDELDVAGEPFRVVGIFESDSLFENGGLIVPLATLQRMMGREGQVTGFVIQARSSDPAAIAALRKRIEARDPRRGGDPGARLRGARHPDPAGQGDGLGDVGRSPCVLGSVGMLNTMMMAVFERTHEIGILRALGWRRRRVLALILGEAVCLGCSARRSGWSWPWSACEPCCWRRRPGASSTPTCPRRSSCSAWSWACC